MKIYLVGGAVRDKLLGYPSIERDWVVVGASPESLLQQGYTSVGKDFPVFLHPETKEEYALARKERKTQPGYAGFEFDVDRHVTLEEDLMRRDLTINAIAENDDGSYVDPFNGQKDMADRILRHVSLAFAEDPVRILRVARFAARYHHLGFTVAEETYTLMSSMVASGEVNHLVAERVWQEFEKVLGERSPDIFISVLQKCGALQAILPEVDALFGVPQPEAHHPEIDTGIHTLMVLQQAVILSSNKAIRFASLMHDLGKALTDKSNWPKHHGHETLGLVPLNDLCQRLKVPSEYKELAAITLEFHTHVHRAYELKATTILKLLKRTDAFRRPERFAHFLICCKADSRGRTTFETRNYSQANYLMSALHIASGIEVKEFVKQGLKGKDIGEALDKERIFRLNTLVAANKEKMKAP